MREYIYQKAVNPARLVTEIEAAIPVVLHSDGTNETDGHVETSDNECKVILNSTLSNTNKLILDSVIERHIPGLPVGPILDKDNNVRTAPEPRPGSEKYFYTHNLCDACSWYEGAVQVTEASCTDSGDHIDWDVDGGHVNFIDLHHGRVFKEDHITNQSTYDILVEVQTGGTGPWNAKTENSWGQTDNDFTFDYETGRITFNSALGASDLVRLSGYKASSSIFTIKPDPGRRVKLEYVEVQYSDNIQMNANVVFSIYGYVQVFAPQLWEGQGGPYPTNTLIPLVEERYKRLRDFYMESTGPFPTIEAHGGPWTLKEVTGISNINTDLDAGWHIINTYHNGTDWVALMSSIIGDRAQQHNIITIPFNYLAYRDLRSSYGMEVHVSIDGDIPVPGEFASVTFYSTTENESS